MIYLNPKMNIIHIIKNKKFTGLDNKTVWALMVSRRIDKVKKILQQL